MPFSRWTPRPAAKRNDRPDGCVADASTATHGPHAMNQIVGSIWWLIVSLGILVTFHEFGHYWVARKLGVRVLRFSVGFGRPLWRRTAKSGTEYQVAMIPLGGYV